MVTLVAIKRALQADPNRSERGHRLPRGVGCKAAVGAFLALTAVAVALIVRSREAVHSAA